MAYKSKKKLARTKVAFGTDGAIMAAATLAASAANTATMIKTSKEQADAMKANADAQATQMQAAAEVNAKSIADQNNNNTKLVEQQIETLKQNNNSQNNILREMNMNLALQAGKQNEEERKEQAKIVVRCGGNLNRRKKLNGGITLQDNNYLLPIGDGAFLLRGGSPNNPQDQTHDNSHKNSIHGGRNTGSYIKVNGREIEAEGGGLNTPGEIVDPNRNLVLSQRRFLPNGTSPVEEVLYNGKTVPQAFAEQEYTKEELGMNDSGYKAKFGKRFLANGGRIKALNGYPNWAEGTWFTPKYRNQNYVMPTINNPINTPTTNNSSVNKGSWWSRQDGATQTNLINTGVNTLGTAASIIGNYFGNQYMKDANDYVSKVINDARNDVAAINERYYNQIKGIDADEVIKDTDLQSTDATANVRAGIYNINPQLTQIERDLLRQQSQINNNINSVAARSKLANTAFIAAQDARNKLYAEQANRVEAINQANISELNKIANENANRRLEAQKLRSNAKLSVAEYNNRLANNVIDLRRANEVDRITGSAETLAQNRLSNAGLNSNFLSNAGGQIGTLFSNIGSTYVANRQNYDNNQNALSIAAVSSTNPNGVGLLAISNPSAYSNNTLKTMYYSATDNTVRSELQKILKQRGVNI